MVTRLFDTNQKSRYVRFQGRDSDCVGSATGVGSLMYRNIIYIIDITQLGVTRPEGHITDYSVHVRFQGRRDVIPPTRLSLIHI